MYSIFDRLARGEPLPRFEQLRSGLLTRLILLGAILATIASHLHIRIRPGRRVRVGQRAQVRRRAGSRRWLGLRPRQRAILLYPLAIALTVGSIVLAARSGPDRSCLPVRAVAAAKNIVARSSLCPPGTVSPATATYGH